MRGGLRCPRRLASAQKKRSLCRRRLFAKRYKTVHALAVVGCGGALYRHRARAVALRVGGQAALTIFWVVLLWVRLSRVSCAKKSRPSAGSRTPGMGWQPGGGEGGGKVGAVRLGLSLQCGEDCCVCGQGVPSFYNKGGVVCNQSGRRSAKRQAVAAKKGACCFAGTREIWAYTQGKAYCASNSLGATLQMSTAPMRVKIPSGSM